MPPVETAGLTSTALYWSPAAEGPDGDRRRSGPAVEVACRLVPARSDRQDAQGNRVGYDVRMLSSYPLNVGGLVWEGSVGGSVGAEEPLPPSGSGPVYEVVRDVSTPDVKGRLRVYEYELVRSGLPLPPFLPQE